MPDGYPIEVVWYFLCRHQNPLTILARASIMSIMNQLSTAQRAKVVSVLVVGNSLRATSRITDIERMTIEKLLVDGGAAEPHGGRYSPARFTGATRKTVVGRPDPRHVSTSFVERQNLTMRMHMRRFTRLTNGFSKKIEMHTHSVALHFAYYNFCKIHQTFRITPAMAAGVSDHVWEIAELLSLLECRQPAL